MTGIVVSSEFFWPAQAFLHKDVPGTGWDDPDTEWFHIVGSHGSHLFAFLRPPKTGNQTKKLSDKIV